MLGPLNALTGKRTKLKWTPERQKILKEAIDQVAKNALMYLPNWNEPMHIMVDSSMEGTGGFLFQIINDIVCPIMFWSKAYQKRMKKWSIVDLEAYSILLGDLQMP